MLYTNYNGRCRLFDTTIKNCKVPHSKSTDLNRIQVTTITCCNIQVKHYYTMLATATGNCAVTNVTYNENKYYVVTWTVYLEVPTPTPVKTSSDRCYVPTLLAGSVAVQGKVWPVLPLKLLLNQWFSNWVPRSFWGPRENFLVTAKHLSKKSTRRSWRKKFCVK